MERERELPGLKGVCSTAATQARRASCTIAGCARGSASGKTTPVWAPNDQATLAATRSPDMSSTCTRSCLTKSKGAFKLEPAVRVVDDLRALEAAALMDKGMRPDRRACEPPACGF